MRRRSCGSIFFLSLLGVSACSDSDGGGGEPGPTAVSLHFLRPSGDYSGWTANVTGAVEAQLQPASTDHVSATFVLDPIPSGPIEVQFTDGSKFEPPMPFTLDPASTTEAWLPEGAEEPLYRAPMGLPGPDQVVVYYKRPDNAYDGWGLHIWGDVVQETQWTAPLAWEAVDPDLGAYFLVDVQESGDQVNLIVHMGDTKDPGPDMGFKISELGRITFVASGSSVITSRPVSPGIRGASAHWLTSSVLAFKLDTAEATTFELRYSPTADITIEDGVVEGGTGVALTRNPDGLSDELKAKWPHLRTFPAFDLAPEAPVDEMLKSQLVAISRRPDGTVADATLVQIPGVVDERYAYDGPLGVTFEGEVPTLTVWAPTAQNVRLVRLDAALSPIETLDMARGESGAWTIAGTADWYDTYYRYEVEVYHPLVDGGSVVTTEVTDPYSVSLALDSQATHIISLDDPQTKPSGWDELEKPDLAAPEDVTVYELHVRDFSVSDATVPEAHRGTFMAFTHNGEGQRTLSNGMAHLKGLADAGLTILHVLPSFDIATVDEDVANRVEITDGFDRLCAINRDVPDADCTQFGTQIIRDVLAGLDPSTGEAQRIMSYIRGLDGFNWGYDPFHYTAPEGSYATDPAGAARIKEFREMVQALSEVGLRTALDVVYNHTNAGGIADKSVLDRIVPGYYHRLNLTSGSIENSTCCQNTATEHAMMERLMIDSVVTWTTDYKVDAFRFDLMGHHMKVNMENLQAALAGLTPENDGVDGSKVYLYGEGWNFGEVQDNARGVNATQLNMPNTGVGTFNDRLRDGARGGGPFDNGETIVANQGFINGMYNLPNREDRNLEEDKQALLIASDQIRIGMAGNMSAFRLVNYRGEAVFGSNIEYGSGTNAGYTVDPQESVNYVSKHDNQTLFDINAYKAAAGTSMDDRVRMQNLGLSIVTLGNGIPFLHAGSDMLRSKSMERNSYDSGDWFNVLDFSYEDNNWNKGLPREDEDGGNWGLIQGIIADPAIAPTKGHIERNADHMKEVLGVRYSTVLLRLRTGDDVKKRVDFHNVGPDQVPGMIFMTVSDGTCAGEDLDPQHDGVAVMINATGEPQSFTVDGIDDMELHPVLASSSDPVVTTASYAEGTFTTPALTTAVFVMPQSEGQGIGLPCNER